MPSKLSTEPYRGTRDLYPEDKAIQNYIFSVMRKTAERFGYVEYDASLLEESALYEAKTGDEIVNEQTYAFTDRGGRKVTIRPEMTPTVARMIARRRKELAFPLRWYSIPNLFRYERPQRGRLREHWQLNADVFGMNALDADVEVIALASAIMRTFGANEKDFAIHINSRRLMDEFFNGIAGLEPETVHKLAKLIDRKTKMEKAEFEKGVEEFAGGAASSIHDFLAATKIADLPQELQITGAARDLATLLEKLHEQGITNVTFLPSLMRGFDYYTATVFEVFDNDPSNNRSLFGGGRYDDLVKIFGTDPVPAVGFGMGDVTIKDFLETHELLPELRSSTDLYICILKEELDSFANTLASALREKGINVAIDFTGRKLDAQLKTAVKQNIPYFVCIGENEQKTEQFKLKNLRSRKEIAVNTVELASQILQERE